MSIADRWTSRLGELDRLGQLRKLTPPRGIDFSSNDYLGFSKSRWPTGADASRSGASSRLVRGNHEIWEEVEITLAQLHGSAALMMTSGYAANEGLLSTVIEPQDWVGSDELNHASIIDGIRLSKADKFLFRHNDLEHLESGLREAAASRAPGRELFIVTEALFGMEGDCPRFPELISLAKKYAAHLIVDEAHTTGCFGRQGLGLLEEFGREQILASVHTGGKALAVPGAYIACSRILKEYLVNRCRHFIYTTALPPAVGAWWLETIHRVSSYAKERENLVGNAQAFRHALTDHGIGARGKHYIVPIILGDNSAAVGAGEALQKEGFDVRAIRPPTVPPGTARLRISIHADHDQATLLALAEALARILKQIRPAGSCF
ncbi:MAG TPA: 8-amino-7-oxononanoate synthase [Gemmataceae bacterium]|jgi:8-amino-7-oxononanoate synthase|nr:8-amino-7-oxononanoate synthase [Gemmataceae bacterium]